MKNAREIAVLTLTDVHRDGAYSNLALKKRLDKDMPGAEKRLATTLVYGVIKRQLTLDYIIGQYSKIKLKKYPIIFWKFCGWGCISFCIWIRFPRPRR